MRHPHRLWFWPILVITLLIYAVMVGWSLPYITAEAAGQVPFDLRPMGYSPEEARAFLSALSSAGASFYLNVQHRLDLLYPALLALTLGSALFLLAPASWGQWRVVLALLPLLGAVFDYLENAAVAHLVLTGPDVAETAIKAASRWTILKSAGSMVAMTVLLIMLAIWFFHRRRSRVAS